MTTYTQHGVMAGDSKDLSQNSRLVSPEFQEVAAQGETVYGHGGASVRIKEILKERTLNEILFKRFYDLQCD